MKLFKVVVEGHVYILDSMEDKDNQRIAFINKQPVPGSEKGELETVNDGTTNEAVLEMLIDRLMYLNNRMACRENSIAITKLEEALMWLEKRTADRIDRKVEGKEKK